MTTTIETTAGRAYGHVPGHAYHDVRCTLRRLPGGDWRCTLTEVYGSAQERDEEHGRHVWTGRGADPDAACGAAIDRMPDDDADDADARRYACTATAEALAEAEGGAS